MKEYESPEAEAIMLGPQEVVCNLYPQSENESIRDGGEEGWENE